MQKVQSDIKTKAENKQAIFRHILNFGAATKQDLFTNLGLSLPTIKQALHVLENEQLIAEGKKVENTGGRNAVSYCVKNDGRYAIGVFPSLHHIICASVNLYGDVLCTQRISCALNLQDTAYMNRMVDLISAVKRETALPDDRFLGVGIAIPSLVSPDGETTVYGMSSNFTGVTRRFFSEYIPYPVKMYHDSETAGFAEIWRTTDRGNMIYLNLNSTIGSSFFLDGKLYTGDNIRAGELGHVIIDPHSRRRCYCGQCGCFDAICNVAVLESCAGGSLSRFFEQLAAEEKDIKKVWNTYTNHLALAIHNLKMMLDCTIIIGGYLGAEIGPFIDDLYRKIDKLSVFTPYSKAYVYPCKYKREATAAGAALRIIDHYIDNL